MMSDLKRWQSTSMAAIAAVLIAAFNMAACTTAVARDTSKVNAAELQRLVDEAHAKYKDLKDGKNADYIPILATIPSELFGVAIALPDGTVFTAGDVDYRSQSSRPRNRLPPRWLCSSMAAPRRSWTRSVSSRPACRSTR